MPSGEAYTLQSSEQRRPIVHRAINHVTDLQSAVGGSLCLCTRYASDSASPKISSKKCMKRIEDEKEYSHSPL